MKELFMEKNISLVSSYNCSYDLIRVLAIFFVICIHSMGLMNDVAWNETLSLSYIMSIVLNGIIHTGVPLFVLLSGALLLGKDESLSLFFSKRAKRILIPFFLWSIIVYTILFLQGGGDNIWCYLRVFILKILTDGVYGIYWYVYMILGLYLLIPIFRIFFFYASRRIVFYMAAILLVIYVLISLFPSIELAYRFSSPNLVWICYLVWGHVITRYLQSKPNFVLYSWIGLCFSLVLNMLNYIYDFTAFSFTFLVAIFLFCVLLNKSLNEKILKSKWIFKWILFISSVSYGIYLSHFIFISILVKLGLSDFFPLFIWPLIMAILVLIFELIFMYIIKRIGLGCLLM